MNTQVAPPSHLWKKGQSGNVAGRPVGVKNKITLVKLQIEGELRGQTKHDMQAVLAKAVEMAKAGDKDMIKMLVDKWISPARAGADDDAPREKVQIVIGRLDQEPVVIKKGQTYNQTQETDSP
jgi:hypothetical protein